MCLIISDRGRSDELLDTRDDVEAPPWDKSRMRKNNSRQ